MGRVVKECDALGKDGGRLLVKADVTGWDSVRLRWLGRVIVV